jgi:hypothetical protein
MEAYIGMDYERGLNMLKQYIEEGKVDTKLEFFGVQKVEGCNYIGIRASTSMKDMPNSMGGNFATLFDVAQDKMNGVYFSQYHKFDMVKNQVEYTAGVAVSEFPESLPDGVSKSNLPALNLQTVRHTGWYDYLGNPWSAAQMMIRGKEFKPKKGIHPLEFYINNPQDVKKEDLITDVCFAV